VNTVGVMGKGIALQFRRRFPEMFRAYERAAKRQEIHLGQMQVWETAAMTGPRFIINFSTKGHWQQCTSHLSAGQGTGHVGPTPTQVMPKGRGLGFGHGKFDDGGGVQVAGPFTAHRGAAGQGSTTAAPVRSPRQGFRKVVKIVSWLRPPTDVAVLPFGRAGYSRVRLAST